MLEVASIFTDGIILQREKKIVIWGKAENGEKVTVNFKNQSESVIVINNYWEVSLEAEKKGGPYEMTIDTSNECIRIKDIYLGDVYLAGGQSNMEFKLEQDINCKKAVQEISKKNIRYYDVVKLDYEDENQIENKSENKWMNVTPKNMLKFSAVAYYFANDLSKEVDVPIGIIGCNRGGTSATAWMDEGYIKRSEEIRKVYLENYYEILENQTDAEEEERNKEYYNKVYEYEKSVETLKSTNPSTTDGDIIEIVGYYPWPPPMGKKCYLRPSGMYNTMLKKIIPFNLKAVLWYQGSGDTHASSLYKDLLSFMIMNWRNDFRDDKLPFFIVQLPGYEGSEEKDSWPILRECQERVSKEVNDVYMVVAIDCGEQYDIHPVNKYPVGKRLSLLVQQKIYNKAVIGESPKIIEVNKNKTSIELVFNEGVRLNTKYNEEIKDLDLIGEGDKHLDSISRIDGNKIIITSNKKADVKQIRYGWKNYSNANIYDENGLPIAPFKFVIN